MTDAPRAIEVEAVAMTMRFGAFTALDNVTLKVRKGTFHALLGENGAGKSTLVKCMMGFYHATEGNVLVDGRDALIRDPVDAQKLGLGMVYQHFTLVPSLTGAENLVISRADAPGVIQWRAERARLDDFLSSMPFKVPLDRPVSRLSAGEKQKLEILKQLYLGSRFLILDEPTSVLTPAEADEVLGHVRALCEAGQISVLMITHKFREVTAFADDVSVLRRGQLAGHGAVSDLSHDDMARMMMGAQPETAQVTRSDTAGAPVLTLSQATASDRSGLKSIDIDALEVKAGEILGVAGVSGNGQTELMEMLTGQRRLSGGEIRIHGAPYHATRKEQKALKVRYLPEEPLHNACAPRMSVAENIAFRIFDEDGGKPRFWKNARQILSNAEARIAEFNVKTTSPHSPIAALSGGNVQRAVLSRELSGDVDLLIVANPCFGLDFAAVAAIRDRIVQARNRGVAVLLISEDLDEILELSDRIVVMSEGQIAFETTSQNADTAEIGSYMAGHA
ncbi:MAG: ABC transporter ATP-binding protein [Rhodobacteraceae bacterium]|nr:ABC transporter ATP-binding protein [Paracoccaceae bacterium]MAY44525.1 ABC transporter ATP-binding protein [Paracoccaceae bacterium]